jgi:hypothetical protein
MAELAASSSYNLLISKSSAFSSRDTKYHTFLFITTADFIRLFRVSHVPIPGAMDLHFAMSLLSPLQLFFLLLRRPSSACRALISFGHLL